MPDYVAEMPVGDLIYIVSTNSDQQGLENELAPILGEFTLRSATAAEQAEAAEKPDEAWDTTYPRGRSVVLKR